MYIDKYWGNFIGDTEDSFNLLTYLTDMKQKKEISLREIFEDTGLDKLNWDFHTSSDHEYVDDEGLSVNFIYAIDLVVDLAALMLECSVNGSVSMEELDADGDDICITFTEEEKNAMNKALAEFVKDPLSYDLHEMCPDEDMLEMAQVVEELRQELCGR